MILEKLEIQFTANVSNATKNINALKKAATGVKDTGKIKVDADTTKADKKLKSVAKQAQNLPDGDLDVTADTSEAEGKLKEVAKQAESIPDADIDVTADTAEAERRLKEVAKQAQDLPDAEINVKVDSSEAEKQLKDGGSSLFGVGGLKGAAVAASAIGVGKGAFDLAETAYGAQSAQNRLEILLPEEAVERVERYADAMNDAYRLNETATKSRMTNFASAFKGIGVDTENAVEYAERMSNAAIDYASALDKTPQEVTDIMMSLMRGNTAVADNIGIFGLTVDKLDKKAAELETRGLMPENIDDASKKYVALLHIIEENAALQGFTGYWERTSSEFGNQVSVLGDQWTTLKEKVGGLLLPAANWLVGGLNDIASALSNFGNIEEGENFQDKIMSYFGTTDLTDTQIQEIVDNAIGPAKTITSGINTAKSDLDTAYTNFESAYNAFWQNMNTLYISNEPITDELQEKIAALFDGLETAWIDGEKSVIHAQSNAIATYIQSLNASSGFQWNDAAESGIQNIRSYYSKMEAEAMELSNKMSALLRQVFDTEGPDGSKISPEEWEQVQEINKEIAEFNAKKISTEHKAKMQRYADEGAGISHTSATELMNQLLTESAAMKEDLETAYSETKDAYYKLAVEEQEEYEKDPEAYIAEHGSAPMTAQQMLAADGITQMFEGAIANIDADIAAILERTYIEPLMKGMEEAYATMDPNISNAEFLEGYMMQLFAQHDVYDMFSSILAGGGTLGETNQKFYDAYTAAMAMLPYNEKGIQVTPEQLAGMSINDMRWLFASPDYWLGPSAPYQMDFSMRGNYGGSNEKHTQAYEQFMINYLAVVNGDLPLSPYYEYMFERAAQKAGVGKNKTSGAEAGVVLPSYPDGTPMTMEELMGIEPAEKIKIPDGAIILDETYGNEDTNFSGEDGNDVQAWADWLFPDFNLLKMEDDAGFGDNDNSSSSIENGAAETFSSAVDRFGTIVASGIKVQMPSVYSSGIAAGAGAAAASRVLGG